MVNGGSSTGTFNPENSGEEMSTGAFRGLLQSDRSGGSLKYYRSPCLDSENFKQEFQQNSEEIYDVTVGGSASFELRFSPEGSDDHDATVAEGPNDDEVDATVSVKEESCSGQSNPSHNSSTSTPSSSDPNNHSPGRPALSQDMFQETPEDCREQSEVWNTQQLADVNHRLSIRRKQVKRLIMTVIRKRQMAEETLESFKKRLKSL